MRALAHRVVALAPFAQLALVFAGCADALPPGTTPVAAAPVAPGPERALVTFVRPVSTCDTGEWAVVVDEHGQFVADIASGTRVYLETSPGVHHFYAWSSVPLESSDLGINPVGAVRVATRAGESAFVAVEYPQPCQSRSAFELQGISADGPRGGELREWLADTTAVSSDRAARQAALEASPVHLRRHIDLGEAKLRQLDEQRDRASRHAKLLHEVEAQPE